MASNKRTWTEAELETVDDIERKWFDRKTKFQITFVHCGDDHENIEGRFYTTAYVTPVFDTVDKALISLHKWLQDSGWGYGVVDQLEGVVDPDTWRKTLEQYAEKRNEGVLFQVNM